VSFILRCLCFRGSSCIFSNACKFTPAGGKLCISTKLIMPSKDASPDSSEFSNVQPPHPLNNGTANEHPPLSATHLSQHNNGGETPPPLEWIVVRIEVTDTGYGIKARDMAQSKLFCELFLSSLRGGLNMYYSRFQSNRTRKTARLAGYIFDK
jgi:hypothetical protein